MPIIAKHEIEQTLLCGDNIEWENANDAAEEIELDEATQRRLFDFQGKSPVRDAKTLPADFVNGLASIVEAAADSAAEIGAAEAVAKSSPWQLRSIATKNFGGLNLFERSAFESSFDEESLIARRQVI